MIGKKAEEVLNRAVRYAFDRKHEYFTLEHVLLSLTEEAEISQVLAECGADLEKMRAGLENYLDREVPATSEGDSESEGPDSSEHPVATLGIQRLIQRALFHVQSAGKDEIRPEDLLVALFQSKDSYSLSLLKQQGIERLHVIQALSQGASPKEESSKEGDSSGGSAGKSKTVGSDILSQYAVKLNEAAAKNKIDPLVGRQLEVDRVIQTLCRRRKNNPLLVGEAGVGKTAIAEGLALRIVRREVPDLLLNAEVYALDMGTLLAGAKFRGDFEQRLKKILNALVTKKEKGELPILFIDEIHTIIGAGAVSGGVLDAANLLKPFLSRGDIQCIGSTTYSEYRTIFEKDHALARRFQKIDVVELTKEESLQILQGLKVRYEEHHGVKYTSDALKTAVELSAKHLTDRFLPDKAIDVMDEAGAKSRLEHPKSSERLVDVPEIEGVVAQIARIPARSVTTNQKTRLKNLERDLKLTIFGQDMAIESIVSAIQLARSGLRSGEKPVGCFLFCGPTGVGKTELSKQLSLCLGVPFHRFDMSEYGERHTVSRLIGAPPGYVGFEQAGLLTDAVVKQPHSVLLLDEVEKAHPDIWNVLLQVMDHGTLTDNNGKKADFRNCILIMTSNVGSRDLERRPLAMVQHDALATVSRKEVERTFSPEFRNRLDSIIYFNPLDPVTIAQVVGKQLLELESQLLARGVELEVDSEVREWLAVKGYDRLMGARPMARLIQDRIKRPLSQEILFGDLEHGGKVHVLLEKDEIKFQIEAKGAALQADGSSQEGPENHRA